MIVVRHLTGPRAGSVDRLDSKLDRIVFGRRIDCDVLYPPEETIVSREHFALVRKPPGPAGHWTIELFGEPFVAVNGIPADPGQKLPEGARFELGKHGGPSFTVHIEAEPGGDNLPVTEKQEQVKGARVLAAYASRIALAGLAAAILAAAAAGYFYLSAPKPGISAAVREHLLRAAFFVQAPVGTPWGTAFPIGPHTLATNAHIGEKFANLAPGQEMIVRSPGQEGKTYHVVAAKLHPGYRAFLAFLSKDVLRTEIVADIGVPGYDVATLTVAERLPTDAILQLATTAELRALMPGVALATAGYPSERVIGGNALVYGATPQYHEGAVTDLTDFFFLPTDFAHRQLIHHSVPAAGGSSGSPIVDGSGRVVALLNAGNAYEPGPNQERVPSGVLINYGQRVDLLQHLLAGDADREVAADRDYWTQKYAVFPSVTDFIDNYVAARVQDTDRKRRLALARLSEAAGAFTAATRTRNPKGEYLRQIEFPVAAASGTDYVFIAYTHNRSPLQIWIYEGKLLLGHAPLNRQSWLPWLRVKAPAAGELSVRLIHPADQDTSYTFQVFRLETKTVLDGTPAKAAAL